MPPSADLHHSLFLAIDDDEEVSNLLCSAAEKLGFEAKTCSDYNSVESTIDQYKPDVLFLNLTLGRRDGVEVLTLLAKKNSLSRIYLIGAMDEAILDSACRVGLKFGLNVGLSGKKKFLKNLIQFFLS